MPSALSSRPSVQPHRSGNPPLILIVEPDAATSATYIARFALSGWATDAISDGREALAKAISAHPAAIVTEAAVPLLNGIELCRLLRRDPDARNIPIVVVTGETDASEVARARSAGADEVLRKPCSPDRLTHLLRDMIALPASQLVRSSRPIPIEVATPMTELVGRRRHTLAPLAPPPPLVCPRCYRALIYEVSHLGGAEHVEQWDDYYCRDGCGRFQYRHRTKKIRARL